MLASARAFIGTLLKGAVIIIIVLSVFNLLGAGWEAFVSLWETMYKSANSLFGENFLSESPLARKWMGSVAISAAMLAVAWLVGRLKLAKLFSLFSEKKGLFCVKMKSEYTSYPWNYLVGVVMNEHEDKKDGKIYYNICFPNLAGFIILYKVPREQTERVNVEPEELMAAVPFLGAVRLKNL
ncbi:hypothetical protein A3A20_00950 [Candidatus Wolfebacteria bacterium RIFCSPLOWO2_01_FULL_45_19]|uniref:Uncharacterized protein n=1 Tax=Candidatus Wolfebacteria bacterium RIFCSPLOWO2_01_FULL_45_19 TaxID=1802557 RepID=A0A1F8DQA1_9BACT|nr:MAG: hypothetical protein UX23_C0003G0017 [Parcubacteria group bacterium GW2011_GWB1_45_9]OGM90807.1 MAG: hypothetical protein A3A20_00950 [Candidatus Wolfebacteria bacterium RIFCSPLOWO2_01_FULL_45_19]